MTPDPLLAPGEPPAVTLHHPAGAAPLLLLCEHASHRLPRALGDLGLPLAERMRHIGWDIGAKGLAEGLSAALDAPLLLTGYSRLAIDCNRPLDVPSSIPERSEDTVIPGNLGIGAEERAAREAALFHPFREAVEARIGTGRFSALMGVHSFTPVYRGMARPWPVGVLYAAAAPMARAMIAALEAQGLLVGDNEPYRIEAEEDYTVPVQGDARGLPALLIEVRQDLLADEAGITEWTERLLGPIRAALAVTRA